MLYEDIRDLFEGAEEADYEGVPHDYSTTLNKGHGRIERRDCQVISDPSCLEYLSTGQDRLGLRSVIRVVGRRETDSGTTEQARYYISSLAAEARRFLEATRGHRGIENTVHGVLDVSFREDESRGGPETHRRTWR